MILRSMNPLNRHFLIMKNKVAFVKEVVRSTKSNYRMESSYKVAECIARRGKPFTDGDFIKEVFINCSEVLFEDLPE